MRQSLKVYFFIDYLLIYLYHKVDNGMKKALAGFEISNTNVLDKKTSAVSAEWPVNIGNLKATDNLGEKKRFFLGSPRYLFLNLSVAFNKN